MPACAILPLMSQSTDSQGEETRERLYRDVVGPIDTARSAIVRERQEVVAEIDAYTAFRNRIRTIDVQAPTAGPPSVRVLDSGPATEPSTQLRDAFRETVMAVEHYERIYDECLLEHVASEFSPEVVGWFRPETQVFNSQSKAALVQYSDQSITHRERYLTLLDDEGRQLSQARSRLTNLLSSATDQIPLAADAPAIRELDRMALDRQAAVQVHRTSSAIDGHELHEYLYEAAPSEYPVLTAITRIRRALCS